MRKLSEDERLEVEKVALKKLLEFSKMEPGIYFAENLLIGETKKGLGNLKRCAIYPGDLPRILSHSLREGYVQWATVTSRRPPFPEDKHERGFLRDGSVTRTGYRADINKEDEIERFLEGN